MDPEKVKAENEKLKKELNELKKSRPDVSQLEATIKELYATVGSKSVVVKIFQKKNGVPLLLKIISKKATDNGLVVEVE